MGVSNNGRVPSAAAPTWIDLSIVLPAFNERRRIRPGLEKLLACLTEGELNHLAVEILVVDDGSTDDTAGQAEKLLAPFTHSRVIRIPENTGKGAAVRAGVAKARGATIVFMDVDMAVHPSQLPLLLAALDEADVAIGSRSLPDSKTECDSLLRIVMGRSFAHMVKALTRLPVADTQCGFKAYRAPVARMLFHFSGIDRFAFDVEALTIARQMGLRIAEVPVHWHHVANSRIRPLADSMSMMADLVRTRIGQRMPSIPGTVIRSTTGGAPWREARSAVGPTMPVVQQRGNEALVLFPMCGKDEVGRMRALLEERILDGEFRPVCLTIADLDNMTQLSEVRPCTTDIPHAKTDQNGPAAAPD